MSKYKADIPQKVWQITVQSDSDPSKQYVVSYAEENNHPELLLSDDNDDWEAPDGKYWQCQCPQWFYRSRLNGNDCKHIRRVKEAIMADEPQEPTATWHGTPVWSIGMLQLFALWGASAQFFGNSDTVSPAVLLNTIGWAQKNLKPYVPNTIIEAEAAD